jgi:hypothetical protein
VAFLRTDVSEEIFASSLRPIKTGDLGTMSAVTNNRSTPLKIYITIYYTIVFLPAFFGC